jgi:TRAP-type transport system small permease protein
MVPPEKNLLAIERVSKHLAKIFHFICQYLLVALMLLGVIDVVGRYVFNKPVPGAMQIQMLLMGAIIFLGWVYSQNVKEHVMVDIFTPYYPARLLKILNIVGLFVAAVIFGMIAWQNGVIAAADIQNDRLIPDLYIPVGPFKFVVVLGASITCIICVTQIIRSLIDFSKKKEK